MFDFAQINYSEMNMILILALFVVMIIGLIAQASVKSAFNKYSREYSSSGKTGVQLARELLQANGSSVTVTRVSGQLTDHYNPRSNTVGLSDTVHDDSSVAALAVAAHEIGHVMQYESNYFPIRVRNAILPVASFGSQFGLILIIAGLFFSFVLAEVGVILYAAVFLFQLITLPVEFNASRRGLDMLVSGGYIAHEQEAGARKVLRAAASTYVVAALASLVTLLRLLLIVSGSRRRG